MKVTSQITKIVLVVATLLFTSSFSSRMSCDPDALLSNCASGLDDFVFIKSFNVETVKPADKTEYSYVLSRGINYRIVVCTEKEPGKNMVVNLLDRNHKLIASNYLKSSKKYFPMLSYVCSATGVYYVEAYFDGEKKGCGLNILGFKKN